MLWQKLFSKAFEPIVQNNSSFTTLCLIVSTFLTSEIHYWSISLCQRVAEHKKYNYDLFGVGFVPNSNACTSCLPLLYNYSLDMEWAYDWTNEWWSHRRLYTTEHYNHQKHHWHHPHYPKVTLIGNQWIKIELSQKMNKP